MSSVSSARRRERANQTPTEVNYTQPFRFGRRLDDGTFIEILDIHADVIGFLRIDKNRLQLRSTVEGKKWRVTGALPDNTPSPAG